MNPIERSIRTLAERLIKGQEYYAIVVTLTDAMFLQYKKEEKELEK
jgi:hypothetical protein